MRKFMVAVVDINNGEAILFNDASQNFVNMDLINSPESQAATLQELEDEGYPLVHWTNHPRDQS